MPRCNAGDRGCNMLHAETPPDGRREARAHVREVFRRERVRQNVADGKAKGVPEIRGWCIRQSRRGVELH